MASLVSPPQVPFIARYRKEHCGELLAVGGEDKPRPLKDDQASQHFPPGTIRVRGWLHSGMGAAAAVQLLRGRCARPCSRGGPRLRQCLP